MTRMFRAALVAVVLCAPAVLSAQTPETVAKAYFDAMSAGEIEKMSSMMHPEALKTFRAILLPMLDVAEKTKESSAEALQIFHGVSSIPQLRKLDDVKFFASFFKGMAELQPELIEALKNAEIEMLGHVDEDATAHVVYRMTMQGGSGQVEVVSLEKTAKGWGVMLDGDIEGMATSIRQAFEMQSTEGFDAESDAQFENDMQAAPVEE